ncbi:DNA repair protein complementing XP-C cells homolog [Bacillus rossius redtenbacheri]|uniref:DNA repair protein complementing XP-C cells homolog n=1 Tax=Bacillus rossius redtenbacheri TaxID=93214 RepID=UPI002FDE9CCD
MRTRQATKRNQVTVHKTKNLNDGVRKKKPRLKEESAEDEDKTATHECSAKADVKEESSESSSDEFVKVNELDLDSDFFKPLKKNEFAEIENKIFSEVSRLSDSESALSDDDFEAPRSQNASGSTVGSSKCSKKGQVKENSSTSVTKKTNEKKQEETVSSKLKNKSKNASLRKDSGKCTKNTADDTVDVLQLLTLGEGSSKTITETTKPMTNGRRKRKKDSDSDDSDDDWENVETKDQKPREPSIPKEGVEITLKFPGMYEKRKKKGFDWKAHMLRRLNRVKREIQVLVHKVHLLCWIAHGRYVNSVLNSVELTAVALSLIPSDKCYPPKHSNLKYLEQFVSWFAGAVPLNKETSEEVSGGVIPLQKVLEVQFEKKAANSKRELAMMFICTARAVGLKARLVISLQPLPLKPPSSELCAVSDGEKGKNCKKEKVEEPASSKASKASRKPHTKGKASPSKQAEETKRSRESENESKKNKAAKVLHSKDGASSKKVDDKRGTKSSKPEESTKKKASKVLGREESASEGRTLRARRSGASARYRDGSSDGSGVEEGGNSQGRVSLAVAGGGAKRTPRPGARQQRSDSEFEEDPGGAAGSDSDGDFEPGSSSARVRAPRGDEAAGKKRDRCDVWAEVFLEEEEKWISVDVPRGKIHCISQIYATATHPVTYVLGFNNDQTLKDVTRRYCAQFHTATRRQRVDPGWWARALRGFTGRRTAADREEDEDMDRQLEDRPLPATVSEYKNHPLYALGRHLLKFEAIYPPDAPSLGFVRGEPVYARECVRNLHSREVWLKEAKVVRPGEQPYKVVKARPKYDRMTGQVRTDLPLEVFGEWQVDDYVPPAARDGKVPRNEYGNVELFKPCMLPRGTVHLQVPGLCRVAKKLNIDCVSAVVGFDFHSGGSHPTYDGFVVCEEFEEVLLDAWEKDQEEQEQRQREKLEKRVYGRWKLLIRGLLIRERLKARYSFGADAGTSSAPGGQSSAPGGKSRRAKAAGRRSR